MSASNVTPLRVKRSLQELARILRDSDIPNIATEGDTVVWIDDLCDMKLPGPEQESVITHVLETPIHLDNPYQPRSVTHAYVACIETAPDGSQYVVEVGVDLRRMVIIDKDKAVQ